MISTAQHRGDGNRVRERFRATMAGLLELEVLRVKQRTLVETVLGKIGGPAKLPEEPSRAQRRYWVETDSFGVKLRRSASEDAFHGPVTLRGTSSSPDCSSGDLRHHRAVSRSRTSSGFCGSCDAVSSLSSSSLSSLPGRSFHIGEDRCSPPSDDWIPDDGFLSLADLYPDSHWPEVSGVVQPRVVLHVFYRSDLPCQRGLEVYRYPSPLHAVALLSPHYSPQNQVRGSDVTSPRGWAV